MTREKLVEKWLEWKTDIINTEINSSLSTEINSSAHDSFLVRFTQCYDVNEDDFDYLVTLPLTVAVANK